MFKKLKIYTAYLLMKLACFIEGTQLVSFDFAGKD